MEVYKIFFTALAVCTVSRAEESLFVCEGVSVRLDVQRRENLQFHTFFWRFNNSILILKYLSQSKDLIIFEDYTVSVEFDEKNFSLLLKNMQERHSGIYTAGIRNDEGKQSDVATYRVTVQEAPPTPQVGVALLSSAGGFCKVSVNCSAKDTWASYTCDHAHCTQVANTTSLTGVNITATATDGAVHCHSSNRVGTKTRSESTKDLCQQKVNSNKLSIGLGTFAGIIIVIIIIIIIIIIYKTKRMKSGGSRYM